MEWTDAPDEGKKWMLLLLCCDSIYRKEMGLGMEDAAPRSKMKLPGAAQQRRRGWRPDQAT